MGGQRKGSDTWQKQRQPLPSAPVHTAEVLWLADCWQYQRLLGHRDPAVTVHIFGSHRGSPWDAGGQGEVFMWTWKLRKQQQLGTRARAPMIPFGRQALRNEDHFPQGTSLQPALRVRISELCGSSCSSLRVFSDPCRNWKRLRGVILVTELHLQGVRFSPSGGAVLEPCLFGS